MKYNEIIYEDWKFNYFDTANRYSFIDLEKISSMMEFRRYTRGRNITKDGIYFEYKN